MSYIDASARVDPTAQIGKQVTIGPYCIVGAHAVIGDKTKLESHVVIHAHTIIGSDTNISAFVSLGGPPQHLKHDVRSPSSLHIGDGNIIREFCVIHAGSSVDKGITQVGDSNMFMTHTHIAHDCHIGNGNIFAPGVKIGGHVSVGNNSNLSALIAIHPFCYIGSYCMIGPEVVITRCVPSYWKVAGGEKALAYSVNSIGMKRHGIQPSQIQNIQRAFRLMYAVKPLAHRIADVRTNCEHTPEIIELMDSLQKASATKRGIVPRVKPS